uniref:NADH:ubiquinone reductase (H(+)-translocating) n=1 Tax=Tridentisis candelabrum TaxID=3342687 RepID=B2X7E9_9CNID|nr:NADH dehydrogenase subunit 2 [Keratoisidinae sp. BAL208-1]ABQ86200.1 NADH dehydrogenase subunit 2 [Keratoisidinae sp. BAL208-1]
MELTLGLIILIVLMYGLKAPTLRLATFCLGVILLMSAVGPHLLCWTQAIKMLVMLSGLAILCMLDHRTSHRSSSLLILLVILGNLLLIGSTNLISIYLALEMQTLCMFILVAYNKNSLLSAEAGLKYFVLGALSSGLFLFGCALIYGSTGELELQFIRMSLISYGAGKCLITISLLFKVSAAPFHMWAPDVYEGAPTWVAALLSIVPKLGVLAIIIQIGLNEIGLLMAGLISLIIGAIGALNQTRIKRLLAYSGIGHIGFVLLGIAIGSIESLQASLMYIGAYILTQVLLWSVVLIISPKRDMLIEFSGVSRLNPILALALAAGLLSTAGIPPLIGFLTKWYIILAAVGQGYYLSALIALACSVIAGVYYLRLVKIMFYQPLSTPLVITNILNSRRETGLGKAILIGVSLYLVLTIIVCPSLFFQLTHLIILDLFPCIF